MEVEFIDIRRWRRLIAEEKIRCKKDIRIYKKWLEVLNREREILNIRMLLTEILWLRLGFEAPRGQRASDFAEEEEPVKISHLTKHSSENIKGGARE